MTIENLIDRLNAHIENGNTLSKGVNHFDPNAVGFPKAGSVILEPGQFEDTLTNGKIGIAYAVRPKSGQDLDGAEPARIGYAAVTGKHFILGEAKAVPIRDMQCRCDMSALTEGKHFHIKELPLKTDTRRVICLDVPVKATFSTLPKVFLPAKKDAWNGSTMLCNEPKENYVVFKLTPLE